MKKTLLYIGFCTLGLIFISGIVDLNNLFNYDNQTVPKYISKSNETKENRLTNRGATLGRILFYDKKLSINNTISCASCHLQEFAFSDTATVSKGVNGVTGRHSMRLINAEFSEEVRFFWDERALSLEHQTTQPIQDHVEMGYSGKNGDPSIADLILKMDKIEYYPNLFNFVFGDSIINEERIQMAFAQFVRSIHSFDSKYDKGRVQVSNDNTDFPNYTTQENMGKKLFLDHPPRGGAGCARCHTPPEFSIIASTMNNGVIGVANKPLELDLNVTKAPTLRDLVNSKGESNGPFMHDGSLNTIMDVINHYNELRDNPDNFNLDFRLAGQMHHLDLTQEQKESMVAFLETLSGINVYTEEKWSDPFDQDDNIEIIPLITNVINTNENIAVSVFPNPSSDYITIELPLSTFKLQFMSLEGQLLSSLIIESNDQVNISGLPQGLIILKLQDVENGKLYSGKLIKE